MAKKGYKKPSFPVGTFEEMKKLEKVVKKTLQLKMVKLFSVQLGTK